MAKSDEGHGNEPAWPYSSLILFGFFGADTSAGRRLVRETTVAFVVFAVSVLALTGAFSPPFPELVWVVAMPASIIILGWAYVRYLIALDELSRIIQLQAFAFSYGAAMTVAFGVLAVGLMGAIDAPGSLLWLIVLVEPLRGLALAYFARRYE